MTTQHYTPAYVQSVIAERDELRERLTGMTKHASDLDRTLGESRRRRERDRDEIDRLHLENEHLMNSWRRADAEASLAMEALAKSNAHTVTLPSTWSTPTHLDNSDFEDAKPVTVIGTRWIDKHGDVWTLEADGLLYTPETAPFTYERVEKKFGPLKILADA